MKKAIFCVAMFIASFAVSAQQRPSFRDYLRNSQGSTMISKPIVQAIQPVKKFERPVEGKNLLLKNGMTLNNAKLLKTLPNGNKLYELPMDKMICVVPDMSQFHMPVIGVGRNDFGDKKINGLDTE